MIVNIDLVLLCMPANIAPHKICMCDDSGDAICYMYRVHPHGLRACTESVFLFAKVRMLSCSSRRLAVCTRMNTSRTKKVHFYAFTKCSNAGRHIAEVDIDENEILFTQKVMCDENMKTHGIGLCFLMKKATPRTDELQTMLGLQLAVVNIAKTARVLASQVKVYQDNARLMHHAVLQKVLDDALVSCAES